MALSDLTGDMPAFGAVEDILLSILRPLEYEVPRLKVRTWIEARPTLPYILVRREGGAWASASFGRADPRFVQKGIISVQTFTDGVNSDERGAVLQEIARLCILKARLDNKVIPGSGHIVDMLMTAPAHRVNDWATSTSVVQYANFPKNATRYEATYGIAIRPDLTNQPDLLELFQ